MSLTPTQTLNSFWDEVISNSASQPKGFMTPKCVAHSICRMTICHTCCGFISNLDDHTCKFPGNYLFSYKHLDIPEAKDDVGKLIPSLDSLSLTKRSIFVSEDGYRRVCKHAYRNQSVLHLRESEFNKMFSSQKRVSPLFLPVYPTSYHGVPAFIKALVQFS